MNDLKTIIMSVVGAIFALLAPIQNFMCAMLILFGLNFLFGLVAAVVNGEGWKTKKALMFLVYCAIFYVATCAIFMMGHYMNEKDQAVAIVKIICFVAIYIFGTNIFRNWLNILAPGSAWYKFIDLIYYVLSVKFIEKFDIVKKWQNERNGTEEEGKTILTKKKAKK